MKVTLANNIGFCSGVKKAVDTAFSLYGENVYILGDIIHNQSVINKIKDLKTNVVNDVNEIPSNVDVIIRSHGVSKEVYSILKGKNCIVHDCTCPFVKKIHDLVDKYYNEGFKIYIAGKESHPEVIGINGWCDNSAIIIDDTFNFDQINEKICIVSQTTYSCEKFEKIINNLKKIDNNLVVIFKTICYTTQERQEEAKILSKNNDGMIVIGDPNSSNTTKLYNICKDNCNNTYFVNELNKLKYINLGHLSNVGIVTGASTSLEQSMEVYRFMATENMTMEMIFNEEKKELRKGDKVTVTVSTANDDGLMVYVDGKTDVKIPKEELIAENYNKADYQSGKEIEVLVVGKNPLVLSEKAIAERVRQESVLTELADGKVIDVKIDGFNKGGLTAKYEGFNVFIRSRDIKIGFVKELDKYVGKTLRVKTLKVEKTDRHTEILASQKVLLLEQKDAKEAEKKKIEEEFFANVQVNDVVSGKVVRFAAFGAFVVVNGFDCLAHISDLSWNRVEDPKQVLEIGKTYDFVVLKIEQDKKKVSLGYKQLQAKPWDLVGEKYNVGDVITGKVVRLTPNLGAFVEVEPGVDGLVHVSQITREFSENPLASLAKDQEVTCKILSIDAVKERMSLSIKALIEAPVKEEKVEEEKPKRAKKAKKEVDPENLTSWTEGDSGVSIADLIK